jgi:hypothetical protein
VTGVGIFKVFITKNGNEILWDLEFLSEVTGCRKTQVSDLTGSTVPVKSMPIINKVVSSNPVHGEVYSVKYYVIKFVSDLRQVGGFLRVLRFPPPIKLIGTI